MRTALFYSVVEDGDGSDATRYEHSLVGGWTLARYIEARDAAEEAADDYWSQHDGWEAKWPLTFVIYASEDGPELHRFKVDMEAQPAFTAYSAPPAVAPAAPPQDAETED